MGEKEIAADAKATRRTNVSDTGAAPEDHVTEDAPSDETLAAGERAKGPNAVNVKLA